MTIPIAASSEAPDTASNHGVPAFDHEDALSRMGGDLTLLSEAAQLFAAETVEQLADLKVALNEADVAIAVRVAHSLKGMALTMSTPGLVAHAGELECLGKAGRLEELRQAIPRLEQTLTAAINAMRASSLASREQAPLADRLQ